MLSICWNEDCWWHQSITSAGSTRECSCLNLDLLKKLLRISRNSPRVIRTSRGHTSIWLFAWCNSVYPRIWVRGLVGLDSRVKSDLWGNQHWGWIRSQPWCRLILNLHHQEVVVTIHLLWSMIHRNGYPQHLDGILKLLMSFKLSSISWNMDIIPCLNIKLLMLIISLKLTRIDCKLCANIAYTNLLKLWCAWMPLKRSSNRWLKLMNWLLGRNKACCRSIQTYSCKICMCK